MPDLSLAICMAGLPVEIRSESQKTQHDPKIRQVLPVLAEGRALARNTRPWLGQKILPERCKRIGSENPA